MGPLGVTSLGLQVVSGALQVKTADKVPYGSMLWRNSEALGKQGRETMGSPLAGSPPPLMRQSLNEITVEEMRAVFNGLDINHNGALSVDELHIALDSLGVFVTMDDLHEMLTQVDDDSGCPISTPTSLPSLVPNAALSFLLAVGPAPHLNFMFRPRPLST